MLSISGLAETATLVGEPARTTMLATLMDGRALTAGELARAAGVTASTASGHLSRMLEAGLLALERQGRHHYYRLASPAIAAMLEAMMVVAPPPIRTGPRDQAMRRARTCYDHLAGNIAVAMTDAMIARRQIELSGDGAALTSAGRALFGTIGIELPEQSGQGTILCRLCLDWSERRHHIGGVAGALLYREFLARHWIRQADGSRAISFTPPGRAALERLFAVEV
ncbi:ArsR/SmtB family transcription factor [Sphingomonas crusticola]|uniref:ArsR/SmtB family transcription factor n=1 Tax=Sphingomonas crusticola TaxID=1697973 RepID=UPI000E22A720|nr:helix-turn-helix transcriptional regulator [Sphingomonas crusticola]